MYTADIHAVTIVLVHKYDSAYFIRLCKHYTFMDNMLLLSVQCYYIDN